jgi:AAA domain
MSAHQKPPRPSAFQGDLANLPEALAPLKELPNWVCWKWQLKFNKTGEPKWDKPPFNPARPHAYAKNNDPTTWGTYEQALAVFRRGECDGIGFSLSGTDFGAFDLDDCRDPGTGEIAPEGMAIVERATSYTECTVSGTGLRVIGYGHGATQDHHRKQKIPNSSVEVESYRSADRYIVVTGKPLANTWPHIADIGHVMDEVVAELDGRNNQDNVLPLRPPSQSVADAFLPRELADLVDAGVGPNQDLSASFHHTVNWLGDLGWNAARIEAYIAGKRIVPERYSKRLAQEIARCLQKAKPRESGNTSTQKPLAAPIELFWHGAVDERAPRAWLVHDLIPEKGQGLASGQWGTAKTFVAMDLSASIMTGTPFAGREIDRPGGVLFVAAEGASEIPPRLHGLVEQKLRPLSLALAVSGNPIDANLDALPFAWIEENPSLKDPEGFARMVAVAMQADKLMREKFGLPLVLVIIDTLSASANFKDGNDAAEGQFVMNQLQELSRKTGAFVLAVDHFGKAVETGTRGTSAKEGAADVVLALLADREINGTISNTRMALRKLRAGKTGTETPFDLKTVDIGNGETSCIIEWRAERAVEAAVVTSKKDPWTKSLKVFKGALVTALIEHGQLITPFGKEGATVRAAPDHAVRDEFLKAYPAEPEAKRKAFKRALNEARSRDLICSREISGVDHFWLVDEDE